MAVQITRAPNLPAFDPHLNTATPTQDAASDRTQRQYHALPSLPLFLEARSHALAEPLKAAIIDKTKNEGFTYSDLLSDVAAFKTKLQDALKIQGPSPVEQQSEEPRIAFLVPAGYDYVVAQWAIWAVGAICVPLCMLTSLVGGQ